MVSSILRLLFTAQAVCLLASISGCKSTESPEGIELKTALSLTATLTPVLKPPPRTARDIFNLLGAASTHPTEEAQRSMQKAEALPSKAASDSELAEFYFDRAAAALSIGRDLQELADLRKARYHHDRTSSDMPKRMTYRRLMAAEVRVGNFHAGLDAMMSFVKDGNLSEWNEAMLGEAFGMIGDVEMARHHRNRVQDMLSDRTGASAAVLPRADYGVAIAEGRLNDAKRHLKELLETYEARYRKNTPWFEHDQRRKIANIELVQGNLTNAEIEARAALVGMIRSVGSDTAHTAAILQTLARIRGAWGRFDEAEKLARISLEILQKIGASKESLYYVDAKHTLSKILLLKGNPQESVKELEDIKRELAGSRILFDRYISFDIDVPLAYLGIQDAETAKQMLSRLKKRFESLYGSSDIRTIESKVALELALIESDVFKRDMTELTRAILDYLDKLKLHNAGRERDQTQAWRAKFVLERCLDLYFQSWKKQYSTRTSNIEALDIAFRIVTILTARRVHSALASSIARASLPESDLAKLARREQDAATQIHALNEVLVTHISGPADGSESTVAAQIKSRIAELSIAREAIEKAITQRFPAYGQIINPRQETATEIKSLLAPREVLVVAYSSSRFTYLFAVSPRNEPLFERSSTGRAQVHQIVQRLRGALAPSIKKLGDIPDFDIVLAHSLYRELLGPLRTHLEGADTILFAANGSLQQLPLSLLPTAVHKVSEDMPPLFSKYRGVPWLARTHAVTNLPSVGSLRLLRETKRSGRPSEPFVGFGDPYFSVQQAKLAHETRYRTATARPTAARTVSATLRSKVATRQFDSANLALLPRLPDTADELRSVAISLHADPIRNVFLGEHANETRVKEVNLKSYRVISFATHGLIPGDLDGLDEPALALSSPAVTGNSEDGLLTASEVLSLQLNSDWAILSACNTAAGEDRGAEALSGLGHAFFYAGTRALLASNWPVHSEATTSLMSELFRQPSQLLYESRSHALRLAMMTIVDGKGATDITGKTLYSYAHPLFWAPFSLVGEGGNFQPAN